MLLYVIYDTSKKTLSLPLLAPSVEVARQGLKELNPENLADLEVVPIEILSHPLDILLLQKANKSLAHTYVAGRAQSTLSPTQQAKRGSSPSLGAKNVKQRPKTKKLSK